jgi:thymidylate synthase (FAD)
MLIYPFEDKIGYVSLERYMGDDNTIVSSARVSHLGESKGEDKDKQLINYLVQHYHFSPLEQCEFQFVVKCPLFVRSQWHRHRMWNYNEVSRRYTSEEIQFYIPKKLRLQAKENKQGSTENYIKSIKNIDSFYEYSVQDILENIVGDSLNLYNTLLENGVAREQARMVLPQNLYTKFYAKTDLRNLFHFLALRTDEHAQWEIRQYALAIENIISGLDEFKFVYQSYLDNKERFM